MALAMRSTSAKAAGLYVNAASPWRRALWLAQDLPAAVRGPLLFRPLLRLASALARRSLLLLTKWDERLCNLLGLGRDGGRLGRDDLVRDSAQALSEICLGDAGVQPNFW